jgi:hypothetical protein
MFVIPFVQSRPTARYYSPDENALLPDSTRGGSCTPSRRSVVVVVVEAFQWSTAHNLLELEGSTVQCVYCHAHASSAWFTVRRYVSAAVSRRVALEHLLLVQ